MPNFLFIDKQFNSRHALNLTVLGSPTVRGKVGDAFQEMYDLAGTTRYNPFWGYRNGEKRNGYVNHSHQPIALLRYDLKSSRQTGLMVVGFFQGGHNGSTRLDWFKALNPEPDFNRRLPSALSDPVKAAEWAEMLRQNENLRQIDWAGLREANTVSVEIIFDANGIPGNMVTGKRSQYVVADFRTLGWCFGGTWSLQATLLLGDRARACVVYYGMPERDVERLRSLKTDVLFVHAKRDRWITDELVSSFAESMRAAGKMLHLREYDADHAFANPTGQRYHEPSAREARAAVLEYLKKSL